MGFQNLCNVGVFAGAAATWARCFALAQRLDADSDLGRSQQSLLLGHGFRLSDKCLRTLTFVVVTDKWPHKPPDEPRTDASLLPAGRSRAVVARNEPTAAVVFFHPDFTVATSRFDAEACGR